MEEMRQILKSQNLCVLATYADEKPHCSLMAYIIDDTCQVLYMLTPKKTRKFANLCANPRVSLLVDTRLADGRPQPRDKICALTVGGTCAVVKDGDRERGICQRFVQVHSHLAAFVNEEDIAVFEVRITSLQLLQGARDATYETID